MNIWFRLLPAVAMSAACGIYAAHADRLCDAPPPAVAKFLPPLPKGCHAKRIEASGGLTFGIVNSAKAKAIAAWKREVISQFGERFQEVEVAACYSEDCTSGAISGTQRCTISAYPCASDMAQEDKEAVKRLASVDDRDGRAEDLPRRDEEPRRMEEPRHADRFDGPPPVIDRRELTHHEIAEIQHLLNRAGYRVLEDGVFGNDSRDALIAWERRVGMRDDGYPSAEVLERLRGFR